MNEYRYDNHTVQGFILSSIFWGVVGIIIGLWISVQLWMPSLNFAPFFTYGRLRVVHTNGLAFGLGVGAIFGLSYYIVMRLTRRPLLFPKLARFHLYLFNAAIALAELEYAYIRAPFDAVVLTKNADVGNIITPLGAGANAKATGGTIADMNSLQVEVDVSESNISMVTVKQPCEIQLDALPDIRFRGEVHMVVPTADLTKATVLVKVKFIDSDPRTLPEMSAKVAFLEKQMTGDDLRPRTVVNSDSLLMRDGKASVFLIRDGQLVETQVTTGEKIGEMVEILSGAKAGDRIVRKPSESLKTGTRVTISEIE